MKSIEKTLFTRSIVRTSAYLSIGAALILAAILKSVINNQVLFIIIASIEGIVLVFIVINNFILTKKINEIKKNYPKEYAKVLQKQRKWNIDHPDSGGSSNYGL